jgi:uncharacterized membrane protein
MFKLFLILASIIFLIDSVYIFLFKEYFSRLFGNVQKSPLNIRWSGFISTYLFMAAVIYYFGFVVNMTSLDMFILGLSIYGIYELTNYSTLSRWDLKMVILDTLWGGILFYLTHRITSSMLKN